MSRPLVLLVISLCAVLATEEAGHGGGAGQHKAHQPIRTPHTDAQGHHAEYDHEAVLGSRHDFSGLSDAEAKQKLLVLVEKMDTDSDGFVNRDELTHWIRNNLIALDAEEALDNMDESDRNHDNHVTWEEHLISTYDYTAQEAEEVRKEGKEGNQDFLQMVAEDEVKFKLADQDGDGQLSAPEYAAFMHPYNYPRLYEAEMDSIMREHDKNKDGFVDFEEFLGDEPAPSKEDEIAERDQFRDYDADNDNRLSRPEVAVWVLPDHQKTAMEEAGHLIEETDTDKDGVLSPDEISREVDLWVGSAAVDADAHDDDEEDYDDDHDEL